MARDLFPFLEGVGRGGGSARPYPNKRTSCTRIFFYTPLASRSYNNFSPFYNSTKVPTVFELSSRVHPQRSYSRYIHKHFEDFLSNSDFIDQLLQARKHHSIFRATSSHGLTKIQGLLAQGSLYIRTDDKFRRARHADRLDLSYSCSFGVYFGGSHGALSD